MKKKKIEEITFTTYSMSEIDIHFKAGQTPEVVCTMPIKMFIIGLSKEEQKALKKAL